MDLTELLNTCLNDAMCKEKTRIKNPNSNKIAEFVDDWIKLKNLNTPAVMGELTCDNCGCHPNVIYTTSKGRFCEMCRAVGFDAFEFKPLF